MTVRSPLGRALASNDAAYFEKAAQRENARREEQAPLLAHAGLVERVSPATQRAQLKRQHDGLTEHMRKISDRNIADMWGTLALMQRCRELGGDMVELIRRLEWRPDGQKMEAARQWVTRLEAGLPAVEPQKIPKPHACYKWLMRLMRGHIPLPPEADVARQRGDYPELGRIRGELWDEHKTNCTGCSEAASSAIGKS